MKFSTKAIHCGQDPDPATGATIVPIYQTSTYTQSAVGMHKGFDYTRTINPTRLALERQLAALEEARYASAFASGMAATAAVMSLLRPGDHAVVGDDIYGGTYRLFSSVLARQGLEFSFVDMTDSAAVRAAIRAETKLLWIETPTNPLLSIVDIPQMCAMRGAALAVVDNTFASPFLQQPLMLGADVVVHSTTKYIGGHSDVVGGIAMTNDPDIAAQIAFYQNAAGGVPSPHDAWLTMRGAKTLALRMREQSLNAAAIAQFLSQSPLAAKVYYPGLLSHPGHAVAKRQMRAFGGMVSFEPAGTREQAFEVAKGMRYFSLAESLGGVESLVCNPARMTHGAIPAQEREKRGITDRLLRLSVGIEDVDDLIDDLQSALERALRPGSSDTAPRTPSPNPVLR